MTEGGYHVSIGGQTQGPYPLDDLVAWQMKGELDASALVWDGSAWKPAAEILGPRGGGPSSPAASKVSSRNRSFSIPAGATVLIGQPKQPMTRSRSDAIAHLVGSMDGVREAHLPQCFIPGVIDPAAQVLVLVFEPGADEARILEDVGLGLKKVLLENEFVDIWPMRKTHEMLSTVRDAACRIFIRQMYADNSIVEDVISSKQQSDVKDKPRRIFGHIVAGTIGLALVCLIGRSFFGPPDRDGYGIFYHCG